MSTAVRVLVVDDEPEPRAAAMAALEGSGFAVEAARSAEEALPQVRVGAFDVVVTDLVMPGLDGISLLRLTKEFDPSIEVVLVTGDEKVGTAVQAMKLGAFDYVSKPVHPDELRHLVEIAADRRSLRTELSSLKRDMKQKYRFESLIGISDPMQAVYRIIEKVCRSMANVVVEGASGTGKELVARAIHYNSDRSEKPFVAVNCGAISHGLLESELFGYVKGAFTGAHRDRVGYFEAADGGTLFLDEVTEVTPDLQVKLLRVVQEREVLRVGDSMPRKIDVRMIAASNRDLERAVAEGAFREDLYYRLDVVSIHLPPLRERTDDIPLLVKEFLGRYGQSADHPILGVDRDAMDVLVSYPWPGNVRELENTVERAVTLSNDPWISTKDLPNRLLEHAGIERSPGAGPHGLSRILHIHSDRDFDFKDEKQKVVEAFDVNAITTALRVNGGNISKAAAWLGLGRNAIHKMIRKYDIDPRAHRS